MQNVKLNNGLEMPMLGYGVFRVDAGQDGVKAVKTAIESGYRSIDTAAAYRNEKSVGTAIKESGVAREDIFLTTKLTNADQRSGEVEKAFSKSLTELGTDYVDLYLIHWPVKETYVKTWLELEKIYKSGRAKSIGISNFQINHIEEIKKVWSVVPVMNQIEMHPRLTQKPLIEFCKSQNIVPESWSPLGGTWPDGIQDHLLDNDVLKKIGSKYNKTTAQIILRWNIDLGVVTIPKSVTPSRIRENIDIFDFKLTVEEIAAIDALNLDRRVGPDPDNFNF